jgi:hypothetical protein
MRSVSWIRLERGGIVILAADALAKIASTVNERAGGR